MLFNGDRIVSAAFDCGIVADDDAFLSRDAANPRDHAGSGRSVTVHAIGSQLGKLEKWGTGVEQPLNAFSWKQLAASQVLSARLFATPLSDSMYRCPKIVERCLHRCRICPEFVGGGVEFGLKGGHQDGFNGIGKS